MDGWVFRHVNPWFFLCRRCLCFIRSLWVIDVLYAVLSFQGILLLVSEYSIELYWFGCCKSDEISISIEGLYVKVTVYLFLGEAFWSVDLYLGWRLFTSLLGKVIMISSLRLGFFTSWVDLLLVDSCWRFSFSKIFLDYLFASSWHLLSFRDNLSRIDAKILKSESKYELWSSDSAFFWVLF